jgi:hypothetical protein
MVERTYGKVGLAFVHTADPSRQASDAKLQKFIRSHVSRVQHSRRRRDYDIPERTSSSSDPEGVASHEAITTCCLVYCWLTKEKGLPSDPASYRKSDAKSRTHGRETTPPTSIDEITTLKKNHSSFKSAFPFRSRQTHCTIRIPSQDDKDRIFRSSPESPIQAGVQSPVDELGLILQSLGLNICDCMVLLLIAIINKASKLTGVGSPADYHRKSCKRHRCLQSWRWSKCICCFNV